MKCYKKIIDYWRFLPKSIYYNFRHLPFSQAIHLPIIVSNGVSFNVNGLIKIDSEIISFGMIKIGFAQSEFFSNRENKTILHVALGGRCIFLGCANIAAGSKISVKSAHVILGRNFWCTGPILIISRTGIEIGDNCTMSWGITLMDHDAHTIRYVNNNISTPEPIFIGNHCWFGFGSSVLKGVVLPDNTIVAAKAVVTSEIREKLIRNFVIGGIPAKPLLQYYEWS